MRREPREQRQDAHRTAGLRPLKFLLALFLIVGVVATVNVFLNWR